MCWNFMDCCFRDDSQHVAKIYYKKLLDTFRPDTPFVIINIFKRCLWSLAEDRIDFIQVNQTMFFILRKVSKKAKFGNPKPASNLFANSDLT